jgi:hypothetical protein
LSNSYIFNIKSIVLYFLERSLIELVDLENLFKKFDNTFFINYALKEQDIPSLSKSHYVHTYILCRNLKNSSYFIINIGVVIDDKLKEKIKKDYKRKREFFSLLNNEYLPSFLINGQSSEEYEFKIQSMYEFDTAESLFNALIN